MLVACERDYLPTLMGIYRNISSIFIHFRGYLAFDSGIKRCKAPFYTAMEA